MRVCSEIVPLALPMVEMLAKNPAAIILAGDRPAAVACRAAARDVRHDVCMVPDELTNFFTAAASAAGALVGLTFVAISVSSGRLAESADTQLYRLRATTSLTAFTNAFAVSMFALIPSAALPWVTAVVAVSGLSFVAGSLVSLVRVRGLRRDDLFEMLFLVGLAAIFVVQLVAGIALARDADATEVVQTIAGLIVAFFLIGIDRAWRLIGGPSMGLGDEVTKLFTVGRRDSPPLDRG